MNRSTRTCRNRGGAQVALLWIAAILVLVLGVVLIVVAVGRQPPRVQTAEVLPAPTIALPTIPPGMPGAGQFAMPQGGSYPAMPQSMPGAMPGGMPSGMPPGAMMPPPTSVPTPTPTPPITETFACQEGLEFKVKPEEAVVTINGEVIGRARMWSDDNEFEFPGPGHYYVRISSPGYKDFWCKVNVSSNAEKKTKKIEVELSKIDD